MRHYVLIQRPGLPADIRQAIARLDHQTDEAVLADYNAQCRLGFTGVHAQAIHVLALHQQLKRRFGKGPLTIEDNSLLSFGGCVGWDGDSWQAHLCSDCRCGRWGAN